MSPVRNEDLTELIEQEGQEFVILRSRYSAEHPDYRELGRFPTREEAEAFLAGEMDLSSAVHS